MYYCTHYIGILEHTPQIMRLHVNSAIWCVNLEHIFRELSHKKMYIHI